LKRGKKTNIKIGCHSKIEKDAVAAIEEAKGKLPDSIIWKALALIKNG
jgi:hypothetical protein